MSALDTLSLVDRFVLYVLRVQAGTPGGDDERWSSADTTRMASATGLPDARVRESFATLVSLGLIEEASINDRPYFVLLAGVPR